MSFVNIEELIEDFTYCGASDEIIKAVVHRISLHPDANVEEIRYGYWVNDDFPEKMATVNDVAICTVCNGVAYKSEHGYSILSAHCPHCGAYMNVEVITSDEKEDNPKSAQ